MSREIKIQGFAAVFKQLQKEYTSRQRTMFRSKYYDDNSLEIKQKIDALTSIEIELQNHYCNTYNNDNDEYTITVYDLDDYFTLFNCLNSQNFHCKILKPDKFYITY